MTHVRQQIRDDLRARMSNLTGQVGGPFDSLSEIAPSAAVPCTAVAITDEPPPTLMKGDDDRDVLDRTVSASLVIVAKRVDDLEKLAAEVERRMASPILGRLPSYQGSSFVAPERGGEFKFHAIAIAYSITYRTNEGDPTRVAS